jgi:NADH-quinone oxidoreductase subunit J
MAEVFFFIAGIGAVCGAVGVVMVRNPFYSVLALVFHLLSLAALFLLLQAQFVAAAQVVVYAGAVMVLFLFVIMLLNVKREDHEAGQGLFKAVGAALAAILVAQVATVLVRSGPRAPSASFDASTLKMAEILFSPYFLYVFEATSILILAALVGAVVLAGKES